MHTPMCTSPQTHCKGAHSHHMLGAVLAAQADMPAPDNKTNSRTSEEKQDLTRMA